MYLVVKGMYLACLGRYIGQARYIAALGVYIDVLGGTSVRYARVKSTLQYTGAAE